jgi:Bacterial self-protective colicin-like immunity
MFVLNDKKRLYWLIDQYLENKISASTFEDEYYKSYCLEVDARSLTAKEEKAFDELAAVSNRFNDIEEDLKRYPDIYYTADELHAKVLETKTLLKDFWIYTDAE